MTEEKKRPKFLRRKNKAYSKLGRGRKKKQVWRKPTGRDNKMREKRRGYPAVVSIGYRGTKISRDTLKNKQPIMVMNLADLKNVKESGIAIIGKVGKKKKLEIAAEAKKMKIELYNMNPDKFIEKNKKPEKKKVEKKEDKKKQDTKKTEAKSTEKSVTKEKTKVEDNKK
jgi:large subunit ribosomal protein L32e